MDGLLRDTAVPVEPEDEEDVIGTATLNAVDAVPGLELDVDVSEVELAEAIAKGVILAAMLEITDEEAVPGVAIEPLSGALEELKDVVDENPIEPDSVDEELPEALDEAVDDIMLEDGVLIIALGVDGTMLEDGVLIVALDVDDTMLEDGALVGALDVDDRVLEDGALVGALDVGDTAESEPEALEDDKIIVGDVLETGILDVKDVTEGPADWKAVLVD